MDGRRWFDALLVRLRTMLWFRRTERDLDDELQFHLAMQTRVHLADGLSAAEASQRANRALGGVELTKERCRDARPLRWAHDLGHDLRYALRSLRRTPAFTAVVLTILALGIGANTALFSVTSGVLIRPLAYPDSGQLIRVWTAQPPGSTVQRSGTSMPDYLAWRAGNRSLEEFGAYFPASYNLTGTDRPEVLPASRLTASVWSTLRSAPLLGRVFGADSEVFGAHRVVVLSERLWQRRFGGDPQLIGRSIDLNGQPFAVLGVMPAAFQFPGPLAELWVPLSFPSGDSMNTRANRSFDLLGRLKPGATAADAQADLMRIAEAVRQETPENSGLGVAVERWQDVVVGAIRPTLRLLVAAVGVVLLIACANIASLLQARTAARQHELVVRATLGAGQSRLLRQCLTENLVLAFAAGGLGLALAAALTRALRAAGPIGVPRLQEVSVDGAVFAFASGLTLLTGLACGLWPARLAGRANIHGALNESARTVTAGRRPASARRLLATVEIALSLVLLVGAALLLVSLRRVVQTDPGFQPDHLLTASVTLPSIRYGDAPRVEAFIRQVVERTAALPGIVSAGATTTFPLAPTDWRKFFWVDGQPPPASIAQVPLVNYRQATQAYLQTMGASLRRGRLLTRDDDSSGQPVAVINETIARRFWPGADPVGQRISMNPPDSLVPEEIRRRGQRPPSLTVVGVVADFHQNGLERDANPEVFVPFAQVTGDFLPTFFLVARTAADPLTSVTAIQSVIGGLDRNIPLANVRTMESRLSDSMAQRRFVMLLVGSFATLAVVLALVGLYGVVSFAVAQRRQELGVRAALGATATDLLRLILSEGVRMTALGVTAGLLLAAGLSQLLAAQLFRVQALDPMIYAATSLLLVIVALAACAVPAFRASRTDPALVLRRQ